jgi:hypothetical protein
MGTLYSLTIHQNKLGSQILLAQTLASRDQSPMFLERARLPKLRCDEGAATVEPEADSTSGSVGGLNRRCRFGVQMLGDLPTIGHPC